MKTEKTNKYSETRKNLSREFLASYSLDCKLREVSGFDEGEDMSTSEDIELPEQNPYDGNLKPGQIRLLSQTGELTYAVLLRRWGENAFVVAPFSRFSYPATDEELKTRYDGGLYLQVLQIWNIRTALDGTLKRSWLIGIMPEEDIEDAWKMWESSLGGAEPEASVLERTGVPVFRADDPRIAYRDEEWNKFAKFDEEDARRAVFLDSELTVSSPCSACRSGEMRLAAAETEKNSVSFYSVADTGLMLQIEFSPHDRRTVFSVLDGSGRKTGKLDGCTVVEEENGAVGTFEKGLVEIGAECLADKFAVLDENGDAFEMSRIEE